MIDFGMIVGFIFIAICIWIVFESVRELIRREKSKNYIDPPEKLEEKRNELRQRIDHYKVDKQYIFGKYVLGISYTNGMFVYYRNIYDSREQIFIKALPFKSIVDCKIIQNEESIIFGKNTEPNLKSRTIDRDVVMNRLLGVKNSECNSMHLCFITNDYDEPAFIVNVVSDSIPRYTSEYKLICEDVYNIFITALKIIEAL